MCMGTPHPSLQTKSWKKFRLCPCTCNLLNLDLQILKKEKNCSKELYQRRFIYVSDYTMQFPSPPSPYLIVFNYIDWENFSSIYHLIRLSKKKINKNCLIRPKWFFGLFFFFLQKPKVDESYRP